MKSSARRFTLVMFATCAVLVIGLGLMNYIVDPFDRLGNNRLGVYVTAEREVKADWVRKFPHNALYVGNSRMQAIQASTLNGFRFFNGAFPAANPEQIYWFIDHFAHGQELVVLGIDLGVNDPATLEGDIFGVLDSAATADYLLNLRTVEFSFQTLIASWRGKPSRYLPNGSHSEADWGVGKWRDDPVAGKARLADYKNVVAALAKSSPHRLSFLQKIADTLRERKIPCVLVVPPIHEEAVRHIEALRLQPECKAWVDDVRAIFPHMVDLSTSPYGSVRGFFALDPLHYKAEVGTRFMNEVVVPLAMKVIGGQPK